MSEDAPTLFLSGTDLWQWAQAINALSQLWSRARHRVNERQQQEGRLAYGDAEHATRLHEARAHPPLRLMTDEEHADWAGRVPAELAGQQGTEQFTVWTARLGEEWGVEAHTWSPDGAPTSSLFAVCRDGEDAAQLCRWLREHGGPEDLARLHDLAASTGSQYTEPAPAIQSQGHQTRNRSASPVLSESDWERALRNELPARLADRIIVKDPSHPHHRAWQELHRLADEELARVGADPTQLAKLVHTRPVWRDNIRNPPALAHWAITESRTSPGYEQSVNPRATTTSDAPRTSDAAAGEPSIVEGQVAPGRRRLSQVHTLGEAMEWVAGLDTHNPEHRIEAKRGFGHWGPQVDAALAAKFDTLMARSSDAAQRERRREQHRRAQGPAESVVSGAAEATIDPAAEAILAEDVGKLHPAAAHGMLGHVNPEMDRLLAERFGDDPRFAAKLQMLYPNDGQLESEAAAYRARAEVNLRRAAAHRSQPDVPATSVREDVLGRNASTGDHGAAVTELAAATAAQAQAARPSTVAGDPRLGRVR